VGGIPTSTDVRHLFRQRLRKQVIVTLKDGQAFAGILYDVDPDIVVLRNSASVGDHGERVPVDGEVLLQRSEIAFYQLP
jgi:small nuclear ribonucleoprotein (snRNP)-like protein